MTEYIKEGCKQYENMLVASTQYTGNKKPNKKIFSASMLGNDKLQNFYKFKHGSAESTQFEANTLGSMYQLGVDEATRKYNEEISKKTSNQYESALRLSSELPNGWIISGEMDQIDYENRIIFDNKLTTTTTISKIKKDKKNHSYGLQMAVYNWLMYKASGKTMDEWVDYGLVLSVADKKFSYFDAKTSNQLVFIEIDAYSIKDTEDLLIEATNTLQEYIDLDEEPGECENLFYYTPRGSGKARKPMRCFHYCDFSEKCTYFNNKNPKTHIDDLLGL